MTLRRYLEIQRRYDEAYNTDRAERLKAAGLSDRVAWTKDEWQKFMTVPDGPAVTKLKEWLGEEYREFLYIDPDASELVPASYKPRAES